MKKGWKIFWITCAVVFAVGVAFCFVGAVLGASWNSLSANLPDWIHLGYTVVVPEDEYLESDRNGDVIMEDNTELRSFSDVLAIEVDAEFAEIHMISSDQTDTISVEIANQGLFKKAECYQKNEKLIIETETNVGVNHTGAIWIYVPDIQFDEIEVDIDAGAIYIEEILAKEFSVQVDAGEAVIEKFTAVTVDLECGAGRIEAYGSVDRSIDVECGAGEIVLELAGHKHDYNYDVECGIGEIFIGNESHGGLGHSKRDFNGAGKDMKIECGIGNVEVVFND